MISAVLALQLASCVCADFVHGFTVVGKFADVQTLEPVSDVSAYGITLLADGEIIISSTFGYPPPEEDGSFERTFDQTWYGICSPLGLGAYFAEPPELLTPDRIEIVVFRHGCEQSFVVDVSEHTVVDVEFLDDVIELRDPILVAPCDE